MRNVALDAPFSAPTGIPPVSRVPLSAGSLVIALEPLIDCVGGKNKRRITNTVSKAPRPSSTTYLP